MLKYIINAISKGLAFSKTEARGTFVLAILVVLVVGTTNLVTNQIKTKSTEVYDSAFLSEWVKEVESSYSIKKPKPYKIEKKSTYYSKSILKETNPTKIEIEKIKTSIISDLNTATAEELRKIKGIGKVYSERIIKYRNLLGGFSTKDQLREVYGINDELITKIEKDYSIQSGIETIHINSDSAKVLAQHPYISYDLAWVIINYRKQNGDISQFEELKKIKALDDSLLQKLKPYIK